MKKSFLIFEFLLLASFAFSLDLTILEKDTYIIQNPDGGYDLYIRKKPDIASVLITETTKDAKNEEANYAFRALKYNKINGDEKRLLDGKFLPNNSIYSLIDSTPEPNARFGEAFHIRVPYVIEFGYNDTRHNLVQVLDGTFLNIRSFEKPYADYTGAFAENPFLLRVTQKPIYDNDNKNDALSETPTKYISSAVSTFTELADETVGELLYADKPADILDNIGYALKKGSEDNIQVAFVLDASASMKDDIDGVRKSIIPLIESCSKKYRSFEMALVLYKDYEDDFLTKQVCNFTFDKERFYNGVRNFEVFGGRDIPEAVYEGLDEAMKLSWNDDPNTKRVIILVGDAPPHEIPRGVVTKETVTSSAKQKDILIYPIILPHGPTE